MENHTMPLELIVMNQRKCSVTVMQILALKTWWKDSINIHIVSFNCLKWLIMCWINKVTFWIGIFVWPFLKTLLKRFTNRKHNVSGSFSSNRVFHSLLARLQHFSIEEITTQKWHWLTNNMTIEDLYLFLMFWTGAFCD